MQLFGIIWIDTANFHLDKEPLKGVGKNIWVSLEINLVSLRQRHAQEKSWFILSDGIENGIFRVECWQWVKHKSEMKTFQAHLKT